MHIKSLLLIIIFCAFSGCAYFGAIESSNYLVQSYTTENAVEKRIYDRGKLITSVYVVPITKKYIEAKSRVTSSPHFIKADTTQFAIAVNYTLDKYLNFSLFQFFLNDKESVTVNEFHDTALIESDFPFAFPYHRLFIVNFEKQQEPKFLTVKTPSGNLKFKL